MHQTVVPPHFFISTCCVRFMVITATILYWRAHGVVSDSENPIDKHSIALTHVDRTAIIVLLMRPLQARKAITQVCFTRRAVEWVHAAASTFVMTAHGSDGRKICPSCRCVE